MRPELQPAQSTCPTCGAPMDPRRQSRLIPGTPPPVKTQDLATRIAMLKERIKALKRFDPALAQAEMANLKVLEARLKRA